METAEFDRLVGCFRQVFPDLPANAIPDASVERLAAWDSIAHVTLLNLVQEEFHIEFGMDDFDNATSFAAIAEFVRKSLS